MSETPSTIYLRRARLEAKADEDAAKALTIKNRKANVKVTAIIKG